MKCVRNWFLLFCLEALAAVVLILFSTGYVNPEYISITDSKDGSHIEVKQTESGKIEIIGSGSVLRTIKTFQMEAERDLSAEITWSSAKQAVVNIISKSKSRPLIKIYIDFSDTDISIYEKSDTTDRKSEETKGKQTEETREPAILPEGIGVPVVSMVKDVKEASDIEDKTSTSPAKPPSGETTDDQVNHPDEGRHYDMKIEAGNVYVTLDYGSSWIKTPVNGDRLQDFWLSFYRMGDQSFYIDDDIIMISYTQKYKQPHILVSTDKGISWKDIRIDCGTSNILQIAVAEDGQGGYRIAMMADSKVMFTGMSTNGIDWRFNEPVAANENTSEGMYSMSVMRDGTILITTYQDVAISKDNGKSYTHLKELDSTIAVLVDTSKISYDHNGVYCIPLTDGVAKSRDGETWMVEK